jgi:hypothetical protein
LSIESIYARVVEKIISFIIKSQYTKYNRQQIK